MREGTQAPTTPSAWKRLIHPEHLMAGLALAGLALCWHFNWWTFSDAGPVPLARQKDPGITQYLFGDRVVLALSQLAVGVLAAFLTISLVVHATNRRWLRGLTREGWTVDDHPVDQELRRARETISGLTDENRRLQRFVDNALAPREGGDNPPSS